MILTIHETEHHLERFYVENIVTYMGEEFAQTERVSHVYCEYLVNTVYINSIPLLQHLHTSFI